MTAFNRRGLFAKYCAFEENKLEIKRNIDSPSCFAFSLVKEAWLLSCFNLCFASAFSYFDGHFPYNSG